jgi:uncharacterized BrkB/YihY/UPF0761 family membrane protein
MLGSFLYYSFRIASRAAKKRFTTESTEATEKVLLFTRVEIALPVLLTHIFFSIFSPWPLW